MASLRDLLAGGGVRIVCPQEMAFLLSRTAVNRLMMPT